MKKLMIICSTSFYDRIPEVIDGLKNRFELIMTNGYGEEDNNDYDNISDQQYSDFFKKMFNESREKISKADIFLVLNFDKVKNGSTYKNYIGASTFLEMYEAFMEDKKIYLYNGLPDKNNMLYDEIKSILPIIINSDLDLIED